MYMYINGHREDSSDYFGVRDVSVAISSSFDTIALCETTKCTCIFSLQSVNNYTRCPV